MKKITGIAFLFILFSFAGYAQKTYSTQNLGQSSHKDLDLYLGKAVKLKKAGLFLTIAGPASFATGILIAVESSMGGTEGAYKFGLGMVFAGIGATAAGIPILITGVTRVKKVRDAKAASKGIASMDVIPVTLYNNETQNFQPGIKLRIRF